MLYCAFSPASYRSKSQRTQTRDLTAFSHTDTKDKKVVSAEPLNLLKNIKLLSDSGLVASLKYHRTILPKDERMKRHEWEEKLGDKKW